MKNWSSRIAKQETYIKQINADFKNLWRSVSPVKSVYYFLFLFSFFSLSCNKKNNNQTEISFWAMGAEGEYVQKLVPEFEKQNPGIKVKVQMVPWTAAQEKLVTAYASDNSPDVYQLGNTWVPQFSALGAIENLDTWIQKSPTIKREKYFEGIWDTNVLDGKVYGIPWYVDTRILFYRKDVLAKAGYNVPPKTWEELYDCSKKIKAKLPVEKYPIYIPTNEWAPFVIFGLQADAELLKNNNTYGNFHSKEFQHAFSFLINFIKQDLAPLSISQVTNIYQAFAGEYINMYISGPWNINEFKKWMTGDLANKWMTAPLPNISGEKYPGVSLAGGSSLVMSGHSKKKELAWKFIEYLSTPKVQVELYHLINDLPAMKDAWEDASLKNDIYLKAFYDQFQNVVATPKIPEWEQIVFSKLQQYAEYTARGVMTVDEAMKAMDQDVNKILEKRRWMIGRNNN